MSGKMKKIVGVGGILVGVFGVVMISPWASMNNSVAHASVSQNVQVSQIAKEANVTTAKAPLDLNQMEQKKVHFRIAQNLKDAKVSESQALTIVKGMFNAPAPPMDATFGYLSLDKVGSPLIPDHLVAGKMNKGVVTNYPVWVVRVKGLQLESQGPKRKNRQESTKTTWNSVYTLVDANTGDIFYSVAMKQN